MIIAIDGPAGSGKSTIAKLIAKKFSFKYLDTGAMFRMISYKIIKYNIKLSNISEILKLLNNTKIEIVNTNWVLDGKIVGEEIRSPKIDDIVSKVAENKEIRNYLLIIQRKLSENSNVVLDGRDIGTVVFPNADLKIFLTASIKTRALRRFKDYEGKNISIQKIEKMLEKRDLLDKNREIAPLKKAMDCIEIDTSDKKINEVVREIANYIK